MSGWSDDELKECVVAYFQMAENDANGVSYNKAETYRELSAGPVSARTPKSIEYRMQNISYVLGKMGQPWIEGLKPAQNVGANIAARIQSIIIDINEGLLQVEPIFDRTELNCETRNLRKRGLNIKPKGQVSALKKEVTSTTYARDPQVRAWVLINANGICELCNEPAPFLDKDGDAFLEVHHVIPLAECFRDTTDNAVALCPNCHKRCHYGSDKDVILEKLYSSIDR